MSEILNVFAHNLLELVLALITTMLGYYTKTVFIPWLKDKGIYEQIRRFVLAADKLAKAGEIPKIEKKSYVVKMMQRKNIPVTETTLSYLESIVKELDLMEAQTIGLITGKVEDEDTEEESEE